MNLDKYKEILKQYVSEERYKHSLYTMSMAKKLSDHYDIENEKIILAALLHDCGKYGDYTSSLKNHAENGYNILSEVYGVNDASIKKAIRCHTIGCADMTDMDKIVFLSDKIEESRKYPEVEKLRTLAFQDMDEAIYYYLTVNFEYLKQTGKEIYPESMETFEVFNEKHNQKENIKNILKAFDDKRGYDFTVIDVSKISSLADYFLICSASSERQVKAIADEVEYVIDDSDLTVLHKDGFSTLKWVLIDCGDIVVHIFNQNERSQYNLEELWNQGDFIDVEEFGIENWQ